MTIVGITTDPRGQGGAFEVSADYVACVRRAGGAAVLLPPGETRWRSWLSSIDALIITGGGDIDPSRYGGRLHPSVEEVNPERDQSEIALAREVVARGLPCLCICRGAQILNVAFGGSLIEHLPEATDGRVHHFDPAGGFVAHRVQIRGGSRLSALLSVEAVTVMSSHHQAVSHPGRGLSSVATAGDGVIEAVEMEGQPWLVAVQWHPEVAAVKETSGQRLFDAVVGEARRRKPQGRK